VIILHLSKPTSTYSCVLTRDWNSARGLEAFCKSLKPLYFASIFLALDIPKSLALLPATKSLEVRIEEKDPVARDQLQLAQQEEEEYANPHLVLNDFLKDFGTPAKSPGLHSRTTRSKPSATTIAASVSSTKQKIFCKQAKKAAESDDDQFPHNKSSKSFLRREHRRAKCFRW
jgi:hypothetical protein